MALGSHDRLAVRQNLLQVDLHFGQQAEVHIPRRHGGIHGQEATSQAQQLNQSNAVGVACRLHIRGINTVAGLGTSGVKAEAGVHHGQVIVHSTRNSDQGTFVVNRFQRRRQLKCTLVRPVAAEDEELLAVAHLERRSHVHVTCIAALAFENRASFGMYVLDDVWRQLEPVLRIRQAAEARFHSVDVQDSISLQHVEDSTDGHIFTRTQPTTGNNGRAGCGVLWAEMQLLARPRSQQLIIRSSFT
mmetsp:Transcript_65385/g.153907  ORF Transcript_65385/g.153907 Transcript_65385/m.153907 type:complete len:245 (-) Transcript_65385:3277-4011(-)